MELNPESFECVGIKVGCSGNKMLFAGALQVFSLMIAAATDIHDPLPERSSMKLGLNLDSTQREPRQFPPEAEAPAGFSSWSFICN